jgi:hypothetical protein
VGSNPTRPTNFDRDTMKKASKKASKKVSKKKQEEKLDCMVFLLCRNKATTTIDNTILGKVPACKRCADKMNSIGSK